MKLNPRAALALIPLLALGACTGTSSLSAAPSPAPSTPSAVVATAEGPDPVRHAQNRRVPEGTAWTEHYFDSTDDVELHADVLLPEGLAPGAKVPVILAVGPYFGHSGRLSVEGFRKTGPSPSYFDLVEDAGLLERGYGLVMVDLRGFGGSSGCHDFFGPGEQADVKAALDWVSGQPWSNGAIGMYGKSYDATTGLVAVGLKHEALKAVVASEPLWDPYRNFRSEDGVEKLGIDGFADTYIDIATLPQMPDDTKRYRRNAAWERKNPKCLKQIRVGYRTPGRDSAYWAARDLPAQAAGSTTPLLFTAGFVDFSTETLSMQEFLDNHQGFERGWLGPWEHVRGNQKTEDGRLEMGREGWLEEVMSFYGEHLGAVPPTTTYPAMAVQDSTGAWRAQDTWPVVDQSVTVELGRGGYQDDGLSSETSMLRRSAAMKSPLRITGTPRMTLSAGRDAEVLARLVDVAPNGRGVAIADQAARIRDGEAELEFKALDWTLEKGHFLAVGLGTIPRGETWAASPTGKRVKISAAALTLDLEDPADDVATEGRRSPALRQFRRSYAVDLSRLTGKKGTFELESN